MGTSWRLGLVDSCGEHRGALAATRFVRVGGAIQRAEPVVDETGHGTRLAMILAEEREDIALILAQVFDPSGRTSADAVAAGIDWCLEVGVDLIHLSLGLRADRASLARAVRRATDAGCLLVASVPARGGAPYPAAYPGVIRGTGDARCGFGELSRLDEMTFGACPTTGTDIGRGASVGAAHVTRELTRAMAPNNLAAALVALEARVKWRGPERRTAPLALPAGD